MEDRLSQTDKSRRTGDPEREEKGRAELRS
jgi:hypothetical protein